MKTLLAAALVLLSTVVSAKPLDKDIMIFCGKQVFKAVSVNGTDQPGVSFATLEDGKVLVFTYAQCFVVINPVIV